MLRCSGPWCWQIIGSEETAVFWFVFSATSMETQGLYLVWTRKVVFPGLQHDEPIDSVYDDGGEVLGIVMELILIAFSFSQTSLAASEDRRSCFAVFPRQDLLSKEDH